MGALWAFLLGAIILLAAQHLPLVMHQVVLLAMFGGVVIVLAACALGLTALVRHQVYRVEAGVREREFFSNFV